MNKPEYVKIVKFTLNSMLDLAKSDKCYNLMADTVYYYENKIKTDMVISLDEFLNLCKEVGIK